MHARSIFSLFIQFGGPRNAGGVVLTPRTPPPPPPGSAPEVGLQNGMGGGKRFSDAEGRHTSFEVVLTPTLEVLAIVKGGGGVRHYQPCKGGGGLEKLYPVLTGGAKCFRLVIFPFCSPHAPQLMTGP